MIAAIASFVIWYVTYTRTHVPPNISIAGESVSWLTYNEAADRLDTILNPPSPHIIELVYENEKIASSSSELGAYFDFQTPLHHFQSAATEGSLRGRIAWLVRQAFTQSDAEALIRYDQSALENMIQELDLRVATPAAEPRISLERSGDPSSLSLFPGEFGQAIDAASTIGELERNQVAQNQTIKVSLTRVGTVLGEVEQERTLAFATNLIGKSIELTSEWRSFVLSDQDLISLIHVPDSFDEDTLEKLVDDWSESINRPASEPIFEFDLDSLRASAFSPPRDGLELDRDNTRSELLALLQQMTKSPTTTDDSTEPQTTFQLDLPLMRTPPKTSLAETNGIGIKERIGFGESTYKGSIPNRIYNVSLSAERVSGHLIPPGAEFSFNRALGPVSSSTGFRSAYVIKNGMTTLGDGGGVCQTSTTLFRAVLNAGVEVTRRLPHSYRVSYYEQDQKPGIDATVYTGETDLRFRNDTDTYILIFAEADSANQHMYVELWGTSDGRSAEIVDHKTWNHRPAPAPQYFPDTSLAPGQLKQIDWAAPGVSASFTNVIYDASGTEIRRDTYTSHYRPWAAKYLQGV